MTRRAAALTCLILLLLIPRPARPAPAGTGEGKADHTVLFGLAGSSPWLSLRYERRMYSTTLAGLNLHLAAEAGIGTSPWTFTHEISFPTGISALWGGSRHFLRIGLGLTLTTFEQYDYWKDRDETELRSLIIPSIGYRFGNEGLILGLAFTPIFNPGGGAALLWLGLDIGWGF